jgi:hypothetical protein
VRLAGERGWWEVIRWERGGERLHARPVPKGTVRVFEPAEVIERRAAAQPGPVFDALRYTRHPRDGWPNSEGVAQ